MDAQDLIEERLFLYILLGLALALYANSIQGSFVWDDRAAIITNADVRSSTPIADLFMHDFWGQGIRAADSHKSYRPLTVLTFKMDHYFYGLNANGYHATNVLIYMLTCWSMFSFCKMWLSLQGARLAALLFTIHPIHVEAVASLVGRADCLCGLLYLSAMSFYTSATRSTGIRSYAHFASAVVMALAATFSKEVGVTVFAVLVVLEVIEAMKPAILQCPAFKIAKHDKHSSLTYGYLTHYSLRTSADILHQSLRAIAMSPEHVLRVLLSCLLVVAFFVFRAWLHGEHALFEWTVLSNHIDSLPDWQSRALSYAQTHVLYALKLFYPRHLCFDYGYACITVVHSWCDLRNLLPALLYASLAILLGNAILRLRLSRLIGLALVLLPLLPALNIFLAVGTLLAERLLFVPSIGFCLCLAEFLVEDCAGLWTSINHLLQGQAAGVPSERRVRSLRLALFPVVAACAIRVVTRNQDWQSELQLYSSALQVCPRSLKALANYSVLVNSINTTAARDAALEALELYPLHTAASVNAGVASVRLKEFVRGTALLEYSAALDPSAHKISSYLSNAFLSWANSVEATSPVSQALRQQSAVWVQAALRAGGSTPAMLHLAGTAAMEEGKYLEAMDYYLLAIARSRDISRKLREHSRHVPVEDDVRLAYTYNQLALAANLAQRPQDAIRYYQEGLQLEPNNEALVNNLSTVYKKLGMFAEAHAVLEAGMQSLGENASAATFNNYGNSFLDRNHPALALVYFEKALEKLRASKDKQAEFTYNAEEGSIESTLLRNIALARQRLPSLSA